MSRKHHVDDIHLSICDVEFFRNYEREVEGMIISWESDIGWGEYTIYKGFRDKQWKGDSECMDSGEDKAFLKKLMKLLCDYIINNITV